MTEEEKKEDQFGPIESKAPKGFFSRFSKEAREERRLSKERRRSVEEADKEQRFRKLQAENDARMKLQLEREEIKRKVEFAKLERERERLSKQRDVLKAKKEIEDLKTKRAELKRQRFERSPIGRTISQLFPPKKKKRQSSIRESKSFRELHPPASSRTITKPKTAKRKGVKRKDEDFGLRDLDPLEY